MSSRENLNSSGKSSLVVLKWDQKLNFAFYDIRRVFTDRITYVLIKVSELKKEYSTFCLGIQNVVSKFYFNMEEVHFWSLPFNKYTANRIHHTLMNDAFDSVHLTQGILKGESGLFLTPVFTPWGGGHIAVWRWVIVPLDFALTFGAICAHWPAFSKAE